MARPVRIKRMDMEVSLYYVSRSVTDQANKRWRISRGLNT